MVYSNNFGQTRVGVRVVTQVVNAVDADATAFIAAAGITDLTQAAAISTLVDDLKAYGIWSKMKALYPFVGGSATSHKFNLKDPRDLDAAYRLMFSGGWAHSSTGAAPNGTNAYADTKLHALNVLTNNNYCLSHYSRTQSTSRQETDLVSISNTGTQDIALSQYYSGYGKFFIAGDYVNNVVISNETNTKGLLIGSRTSNVLAKLYFNGSLKTTLTTTNTYPLPNANFRLSANPNNVEYSVRETAFASIGDGLSDTEASNFYTSVQKFQTTLGRQVGTPAVSDSDAQAFLNAASITDTTQSSAINTLVTDLKAAGIWTKMKAVYPFIGGNATSHKFNLKDPRDLNDAYRLTFTGGWTHTITGAKPNGTNAYARTYLVPSTTFGSNNTLLHLSKYQRENLPITSSYWLEGAYSVKSGGGLVFLQYSFSTAYTGSSSVTIGSVDPNASIFSVSNNTQGYFVFSRTSNTSLKAFRNNTLVGTNNYDISTSLEIPSAEFLLGVRNDSYASNLQLNPFGYNPLENSFSTIGNGLTDTESTALYNAVQKYQTTLGRQVDVPLVSDSDAQDFLTAAGITSYTQANAVNTLVTDLKAGGLWTKMKALYPMVGGTSTTHKWNLKDPRDTNDAYRLSFSGGWTHGSTGAKPNGTNAYADTFIVPKNVFNSTTFEHVGYYSRTNTTLTTPPYRYDLGVDNYDAGGNYFGGLSMIIRRDTNATLYSSDYGTLATYRLASTTTSDSLGFFLGSQTGTNIKLYKNNSILSTNTGVSNASYNMLSNSSTRSIWIGTMNELNYITQNRWTDKETGLISIGEGLNDSEASLLYTAVQKFNTSLGRQVGTPVYNNGLVLNLDAGNANSYPGTGTTWFDLASGKNATLLNGPTYNTNGSLLLDGVNDRIDTSYTPGTFTKQTIVAWINRTNTQYCFILQRNSSPPFGFEIYPTTIYVSYGAFEAYVGYNPTGWHQVVYTYDGTQTGNSNRVKVYVNGVLQTLTFSSTVPSSITINDVMQVGWRPWASLYSGFSISTLQMYNTALSEAEVLQNFNNTRGRFGL